MANYCHQAHNVHGMGEMLPLLLMATPEHSATKGTQRHSVNTSRLGIHSEGVAPGSWWVGAPWTIPQPCLLCTRQAWMDRNANSWAWWD